MIGSLIVRALNDSRLNHIFGECLQSLSPMISVQSMFAIRFHAVDLPEDLSKMVELISERDFQYSRQVEEVDKSDALFLLRQKRNRYAAARFLDLLQHDRPDVAIIPNGMILEFGVLYEVARYLGIPAVTYEFGEQRDKIWISQDKPVMFQNTDDLWERFKDQPFTEEQQDQVEALFASRQECFTLEAISPANGRRSHQKARVKSKPSWGWTIARLC